MFDDAGRAVLIDFDSCQREGDKLGLKWGSYGYFRDADHAERENDLYALQKVATYLEKGSVILLGQDGLDVLKCADQDSSAIAVMRFPLRDIPVHVRYLAGPDFGQRGWSRSGSLRLRNKRGMQRFLTSSRRVRPSQETGSRLPCVPLKVL